MIKHLLIIAATLTTTPAMAQPIVTFTFDDAHVSQYLHGHRILKAYDLPATIYVAPGLIGFEQFMTWDQLDAVAEDFEVGSHTFMHTDLLLVNASAIEAELKNSKIVLEGVLNTEVTTFASPYGNYNAEVKELASRYYDAHLIAWGGDEGFNSTSRFDRYEISRFEVEHYHTSTEICSTMASLTDDTWFVMNIHRIVESTPPLNEYEIGVDTLEEIASCAQLLQEQSSIRVLTVSETLTTIGGSNV